MLQSKNLIVVTLAVAGLISTAACSRSGGSSTPPPSAPAQQPLPTPIPHSQSELDGGSGKSAQDDQSGPQTARNTNDPVPSTDVDPTAGGPQTANGSQNAPQTPPQTAPQKGPQTAPQGPIAIVYNPTGLKPEEIYAASAEQGPATNGIITNLKDFTTGERLYVSGSGQDELLAELERVVDTKTKPSRIRGDEVFAKTVSNGRVEVNWGARTAVLDVSIAGPQGSAIYRFSGALDSGLLFRAGDLRHGQNMAVEAACMDLDCNTVYAKVQSASGGTVRTAHMLIRQTKAWLFTRADGFGYAHNEEFDALLRTLVRTDEHAGDLNALNRLTLHTSETINGQASFKIEMGIRSMSNVQESLNFGGPLVKPANDIDLVTPVQVLPSSSPAARTIRNVSLIKNDGRGNLTLAITIRKATPEAQEDTINITVARIHKPVRPLIIN